jgi:hypothetical protein
MGKSLSSDSRKSAFGEAARRSLETCSAGRAGVHPYRRPAERLGPIISTVHTNDSTL